MAIERIDSESCTGCGICVNSCQMDVIRMDEETQKAVIRYPDDCMLCLFCERDCPEGAVYVSPVRTTPIVLSWD